MALQTGVLVAFTQLIPEHQVQLFGVLKMRVKVNRRIYHVTTLFANPFSRRSSDCPCSM